MNVDFLKKHPYYKTFKYETDEDTEYIYYRYLKMINGNSSYQHK